MEITEKVAYLKGLAEGLGLDKETKEGKIIAAMIDILDDIALELEDLGDGLEEVCDGLDAVSEDLEDVENFLFDEDGGDEDEDDYDEEYEAGLYEITCPQCGEVVCVDEDMLANDDLACPNCGTKFEVDFSEDDDACEGCEGCCGGKDEE